MAVLVGLFVVGLAVAVQLSWKEWYITVIAAMFLWASVSPFYLPTRYEMDEDRIRIRTTWSRKEKPWSRYRRAAADARGALLSPFERRSRLDRFHGLNLRYDEKDRERVLGYLGSRVPLDVADG